MVYSKIPENIYYFFCDSVFLYILIFIKSSLIIFKNICVPDNVNVRIRQCNLRSYCIPVYFLKDKYYELIRDSEIRES